MYVINYSIFHFKEDFFYRPGGGRLEEELNFLSRIENLSFNKAHGETGFGGAYQVSSIITISLSFFSRLFS